MGRPLYSQVWADPTCLASTIEKRLGQRTANPRNRRRSLPAAVAARVETKPQSAISNADEQMQALSASISVSRY